MSRKPRSNVRPIGPLACLALALAAAGCADRLHMTPGHGRSVHAAFGNQQVNPEAGKKSRPTAGLDAQEASAVTSNYRKSLVAKDSQPSDQGSLLLVAPPASGGQPNVPPPSVPSEQR
jgi:hypothetical protein